MILLPIPDIILPRISNPPGGTGGQTLVFKKLKFLLTPSILDFVLSGFPAFSDLDADVGLVWFFAHSLPGKSRDMFTRSSTRAPDLKNKKIIVQLQYYLKNGILISALSVRTANFWLAPNLKNINLNCT